MSEETVNNVIESIQNLAKNTLGTIPKIVKHKHGDELSREDFDGGPVSLHEIIDGLWLGNVTAARDLKVLHNYSITHIITVDTCPLPRQITEVSHITNKFIQVADVPKEDLICCFDECFDFIENCLEEKTGILVHCYFGVSRSATIVIAYIMKKRSLTYKEAFEFVKSKRKYVSPNPGFQHQLKLYEKMGYTINKQFPKYREFRLKIAADQVKKVKILPHGFLDLIKCDPGLIQVRPEPLVYKCKKCRRIVASQSNIITHLDKELQINYTIKEKYKSESLVKQDSLESKEEIIDADNVELCHKTYFVEPLAWMKDICHSTQGKLYCPKCNNKIGSFSWVNGCQCPCGQKVSPAFYLVPSKVGWANVVQNVQITV